MRRIALAVALGVLSVAALRCGGDDSTAASGDDGSSSDDAVLPSESSTDAPPSHDAAESGPPLPHFDWIGIVGTGQSLSVGAAGLPVITTTQPFHNLKLLDTGPDPKYPPDGGGVLSLVPLVEPIRTPPGGDYQYPYDIFGETPHSALANQLTAISVAATGRDYVTLHSVVGWSGHPMVDIDKEGTGKAYPGSISEAHTFAKMAGAQGKSFAYGAVVLTHGESDSANPQYEAALHQMHSDYDADLRAITGQAFGVPLLLSQQNTFPGDPTLSLSTIAQWRAGVDYPGQIVCVGPKYQYTYAPDLVHLDAPGYVRLGEKYAEVIDAVFNQQRAWKPLQPSAVARNGLVIAIAFDVPNPPLAWDETIAPPHQQVFAEWAKGRGFELQDTAGLVPIADAKITGPTSVEIELAAPPQGTGLVVRYAMVQDGQGFQGGTIAGRRGQLADSDAFVGYDAESIPCNVQQGSNVVTAAGATTFARRTARDVVTGAGFAAGTIVVAKNSDTVLTLSAPWTGATGAANLGVHHDERNYCVAFQLPVP